jgi:type IV secretion system protein VirD4
MAALGLVPVLWLGLMIAPALPGADVGISGAGGQGLAGRLPEIMARLTAALNDPLHIEWHENSPKIMLIFTAVYAMGIGLYLSTRRNTRPREEHGSAKWGDAAGLSRKYADRRFAENKILTQNVRIGLDGRKHRRNLNVMVVGGSGAGKTRNYVKPNAMNCNTSMVILDPKGEITRDVGRLLEDSGMAVKVLDLINMERSHCYNPFHYLTSDNDVQRLVTNLFKATTPQRRTDPRPLLGYRREYAPDGAGVLPSL